MELKTSGRRKNNTDLVFYGKGSILRAKKVKNTKTGEIFMTIKDAAASVGMNAAILRNQLSGVTINKTDLIFLDDSNKQNTEVNYNTITNDNSVS